MIIAFGMPYYRHALFLINQSYTTVYEYSNECDLPDSYYVLNGVVVFKSQYGNKAEMLMQKPTEYSINSPYSCIPYLSSNEVAVSSNLMEAENKEVGDTISLYSPLSESSIDYLIVEELQDNYGVLNSGIDKNYGVIVFGLSSDIIENNEMNSIVFADNGFSASDEGVTLVGLYSAHEQINFCLARIITIAISVLTASVIIQILVFVLFYVYTNSRLKKLYLYGSSESLINRFINNNYLVAACIVSVISFLLVIILFKIQFFVFITSTILLICNELTIFLLSKLPISLVKRSF